MDRLWWDAWATLLRVRLALVTAPFERVHRRLADAAQQARDDVPREVARTVAPERVAEALARAGRWVPGGRNCLAQALAGKLLFARRGYETQLRLGVAKVRGKIEAHAWLEMDGRILLGRTDGVAFKPFPAKW